MGCAEGGSWDGVQKVQKQGWGGDGYCELAGPPGRCASVLEFCLVFCTVSALTQSSLWLLNFALDSIVLPCPLNVAVAVDERPVGRDRPGSRPAAVSSGEARSGAVVFGAGRDAEGEGRGGGGDSGVPGPDLFPLNGRTF